MTFQAESLQRGVEGEGNTAAILKEVEEVEKKMKELEQEREEKCKRIMDRRVQQVNTLQELGWCISSLRFCFQAKNLAILQAFLGL